MQRYFKKLAGVVNGSYIYYWKSNGLSQERINYIKTYIHSITPSSSYYSTKIRVEFNGSCLQQDNFTFNRRKAVNIYNVYEISKNISISKYPTLNKCFSINCKFIRINTGKEDYDAS